MDEGQVTDEGGTDGDVMEVHAPMIAIAEVPIEATIQADTLVSKTQAFGP